MAGLSEAHESSIGKRVFTCGHSFHVWVAELLADVSKAAGITGHVIVGTSSIGGSAALKHWEIPEEENQAKKALRAGAVDVLTLSCMSEPDDGIRRFAELAVAHNPHVRVTLQELWLPEDRYPFDPFNRVRKSVEEYDESSMADIVVAHEAYFQVMEDYVNGLNREIGSRCISIVPDAQAVLALRALILQGEAPGLARQSELFTDAWGHPGQIVKMLATYCHFSAIYDRSAVGLPVHDRQLDPSIGPVAELAALLQRLAWEAVSAYPMAGVSAGNP